jgi:uncharacterized repeat protein (TIGR01451 family)
VDWYFQVKQLRRADHIVQMQKFLEKITLPSSLGISAFRQSRVVAALTVAFWSHAAFCAQPPAEALTRLNAGRPVDLIVEYEATAIEQEAATMRQRNKRHIDDDSILSFKAGRYKALKDSVDRAAAHPDVEPLVDYSHLPMSFKRFHSQAALNALLARPEIKAVYWNDPLHAVLAQSLPLINQPAAAGVGEVGTGSTVAVIDNGIDYTNAAFGSCTSPSVPASCHVSVSLDFGTGTTDSSHGTNVSAIVLGVAPGSRIAMLNAFSGTSALTSDIINAINWAISNQSAYNIVAINMSLGDGTRNTTLCKNNNAFYTPVTGAINAGITVVAATGNDAYTNGLNKPACTPGIISVGAVYDSNLSNQGYPNGVAWGSLCTDSATASGQITCFSDSASFLTMLAPGAMITAAGITDGGTSQASPFVAGAVAVLRTAFPTESLGQIQTRLISSGKPITDPRNGIITPRLNLLEAARPANDTFANRIVLSGNNGSTNWTNLLATKEPGEPNHAGNSGGHSVWWKWTAPAAGQLSADTHGSSFDTLLAAYTGSSVSALTANAANDNDGSANGTSGMLLQVQAGTEYVLAVDGANGAAGTATLNWSLNTSASTDLAVSITGPAIGSTGTASSYSVSVGNAGPQTATHVVATVTLPASSSLVSGASACTASGSTVTCDAGTLGNGAQMSWPLQLMWNTAGASAIISAAVTSDLPDPSLADNASVIQVVVSTQNATTDGYNNDVPTLPEWGMILMAILFTVAAAQVQHRK